MTKQKAILSMILASIFWSIAGLFIKQVMWHPLVIAGFRSLIAGFFMLFFLKRTDFKYNKRMWYGGITYIFVAGFFVMANKLTTSTNAILLQFTAPIWVLIFTAIIKRERPRTRDMIVIFIVMMGMRLFFVGNLDAGNITGNILAIFAGIALAVMIMIMQGDTQLNPLVVPALGNFLLFFASVPFIFIFPPTLTTSNVINIIILGIVQLGMGYILFSRGVHYVSALEASLIMVIEPLFNPIWVFLFIGEKPTLFSVIGGIIVVIAIVWHQIFDIKRKKIRA